MSAASRVIPGRVIPVILSGGTGTRLWPLSRELYPKQLLPLLSEVSLLQETAWRVRGRRYAAPMVVCSAEHRFVIAEQLRGLGISARAIVLEPTPRDTAAAVAAAAELIAAEDPEALMLVLPSDHAIDDRAAFGAAVTAAAKVARAGHLVTFGVTPQRPETAFGWVKQGAPLPEGGFAVEQFVEKPEEQTARDYLAQGGWLWNSGMFVFPAGLYLDELARLAPDVRLHVARAVRAAAPDLDFVRLEPESFGSAPAISVDHAVMEHTHRAAVVPAEFEWNDVGSWSALWELGERDAAGNVVLGDVITDDSSDCYLRGDGTLIATLGLTNTVVVATSDVVLVADRSRDQDVKALVQRLKVQGRSEAMSHPTVYRPWGSYATIDSGPGYLVKHLTVKPGHRLSLQKHAYRAEHWAVISGVAEVTRGDDVLRLRERMSIDVPVGCLHRLVNPGPELLHVIEVQTGSYIGEDDIVRVEDRRARKRTATRRSAASGTRRRAR
ncbi:MAG: mannose-1-phosphate guanylyltransferase/mannose-6-phosphate isomerase [Nocardioidaceae bacterium]